MQRSTKVSQGKRKIKSLLSDQSDQRKERLHRPICRVGQSDEVVRIYDHKYMKGNYKPAKIDNIVFCEECDGTAFLSRSAGATHSAKHMHEHHLT